MAVVVDSSVIVTLDRAGGTLDDLARAAPDGAAYLASITASELIVGVIRSATLAQQERRRAFVEGVLQQLPILPFDLELARLHAQIVADLMSKGLLISANDIQIGATALGYDCDVLTEDVDHFGRIEGLRVIQPNW